MMTPKKLAALVLGLAALVLNPLFACSELEPGYAFGEVEMRAAVEGTWRISVPAHGADAPALEYTLVIAQGTKVARLQQRGLVAPAAACGSRSFVRTASACIDDTTMPLDVQIVRGPGPAGSTGPSRGEFVVYGRSFQSGELRLTIDAMNVSARISPKGEPSRAQLTDGSERLVEMVRVAPAAAPKT